MYRKYKICDLIVECDFRHDTMLSRSEKFLVETDEKPDIVVPYQDECYKTLHEKAPNFSINDCEVMASATFFYKSLLDFDCFMLHSSAVMVDKKAYLFSAPSGTGKTTHTTQWLKLFGDRATIINDDKPAIGISKQGVFAYGTPWSGCSDLNTVDCAKLQGICILERSPENFIERIDDGTAAYSILNQTIRLPKAEYMDKLLALLDKVIKEVPVWKMGCNISTDAAKVAYEAMSGEKFE